MWKGNNTKRVFPELYLRDTESTKKDAMTLEEKVKSSRVINGKQTIGTLNVSTRVINILVAWEIYYVEDLFSKTIEELRSMKLWAQKIEDIESILKFRNPDFKRFKKN